MMTKLTLNIINTEMRKNFKWRQIKPRYGKEAALISANEGQTEDGLVLRRVYTHSTDVDTKRR